MPGNILLEDGEDLLIDDGTTLFLEDYYGGAPLEGTIHGNAYMMALYEIPYEGAVFIIPETSTTFVVN